MMSSTDGAVEESEAKGGPCGTRRDAAATIGWSLAAGAMMIVSSQVIRRYDMPPLVKLLTVLTPVVPFVFVLWMMVRAARHLDEMWSRVQAEALGGTVLITAVGCFAWGQLQKAGFVETTDVSMVWPAMAFVYAACFSFAKRRYA